MLVFAVPCFVEFIWIQQNTLAPLFLEEATQDVGISFLCRHKIFCIEGGGNSGNQSVSYSSDCN